jgi:hypothetical protein
MIQSCNLNRPTPISHPKSTGAQGGAYVSPPNGGSPSASKLDGSSRPRKTPIHRIYRSTPFLRNHAAPQPHRIPCQLRNTPSQPINRINRSPPLGAPISESAPFIGRTGKSTAPPPSIQIKRKPPHPHPPLSPPINRIDRNTHPSPPPFAFFAFSFASFAVNQRPRPHPPLSSSINRIYRTRLLASVLQADSQESATPHPGCAPSRLPAKPPKPRPTPAPIDRINRTRCLSIPKRLLRPTIAFFAFSFASFAANQRPAPHSPPPQSINRINRRTLLNSNAPNSDRHLSPISRPISESAHGAASVPAPQRGSPPASPWDSCKRLPNPSP